MSHFGIFASGAGTGSCRGAGDGPVCRRRSAAAGLRLRQAAGQRDEWGIILALARDWARGRKYEGELEAVVAGCI